MKLLSPLYLIVPLLAVLGTIQAASLATAESANNNCTLADSFKALTCIVKFTEFIQKTAQLSRNNKESLTEFKETCDSLQSCFESFSCGNLKEQLSQTTPKIKTMCSALLYRFDDFGDCMQKLEDRNSTCFQGWTPLQKVDLTVFTDNEKMEEYKRKMCENVFGEDICMKKEILDDCGEEKWEGAKKHFVALMKISVECNTDDL